MWMKTGIVKAAMNLGIDTRPEMHTTFIYALFTLLCNFVANRASPLRISLIFGSNERYEKDFKKLLLEVFILAEQSAKVETARE